MSDDNSSHDSSGPFDEIFKSALQELNKAGDRGEDRKMPDIDLEIEIRHLSRCAAKTELCVNVFSLWALVSFDSKVFTACPFG
jgi:hypothetical protein